MGNGMGNGMGLGVHLQEQRRWGYCHLRRNKRHIGVDVVDIANYNVMLIRAGKQQALHMQRNLNPMNIIF